MVTNKQVPPLTQNKHTQHYKPLTVSSSNHVLDTLLGGGFTKGNTVLLAGPPGTGKTLFAFQWLFDGIEKKSENSIYLSLTEPLFKNLSNLEMMRFYKRDAIEKQQLTLLDLRREKKEIDPNHLLNALEHHVLQTGSKRVVIDSITAISQQLENTFAIRNFIFRLGDLLATLGCTTLLTSEAATKNLQTPFGVEEFIADTVIALEKVRIGQEYQRCLTVVKNRGRNHKTQRAFYYITNKGLCLYPYSPPTLKHAESRIKVSSGIPGLDRLLSGGFFKGTSTFLAGTTGTGKTLFALHFLIAGLKNNEACLYVSFEESKDALRKNAENFGCNFPQHEQEKRLHLRCEPPESTFIEGHYQTILSLIRRKRIQRCIIDSLSAVANAFPEEHFLSFAKRLYLSLKQHGVTTLFTSAADTKEHMKEFTGSKLSTITDNIIFLRHVEMEGELGHVLTLLKVKGSNHSRQIHRYHITHHGIRIGTPLIGYEGILSGTTHKVATNLEEQILQIFQRFLGPIANVLFEEVKEEGLTEENIFSSIDKLTKDNIIDKEAGKLFRNQINKLLHHNKQPMNQ